MNYTVGLPKMFTGQAPQQAVSRHTKYKYQVLSTRPIKFVPLNKKLFCQRLLLKMTSSCGIITVGCIGLRKTKHGVGVYRCKKRKSTELGENWNNSRKPVSSCQLFSWNIHYKITWFMNSELFRYIQYWYQYMHICILKLNSYNKTN